MHIGVRQIYEAVRQLSLQLCSLNQQHHHIASPDQVPAARAATTNNKLDKYYIELAAPK